MLYCEKCKVHLTGSAQRCPLCQGKLSGKSEEDSYPRLSDRRKPYWLAMRLAGLITVIVLVVCMAVDFSFPEGGRWSFLAAAGLASLWLVIGVAVRKGKNPMKSILWLLGVVSVLAFVWDWRIGFAGWSVNYVLPILIPCMQAAVLIVAWILRLRPSDYLLYLTICVFAGFLPLVLLLCGALRVIYPSVICVSVSAVLLAAMILFRGAALKDEIVRRMHV